MPPETFIAKSAVVNVSEAPKSSVYRISVDVNHILVLSIFVIVKGATNVGAVLSTSIPLVVNEGELLPAISLNTPVTIVIEAEPSSAKLSNTTLT